MEGRGPSDRNGHRNGGAVMNWDVGPWFIAGPLIGLLIVGLRAAVNKPFGALGGFIDLSENAASPQRLGFRAYLLLGLIGGGALFAFISGSFEFSLSYPDYGSIAGGSLVGQSVLLAAAGMIMGFGARAAGGCTSGHGLCGMSLLSPASIVATMTFFATAVGLSFLLAMLGGVS
jgi:uncharacterized protein